MPTHDVINQSPVLAELNVATSDSSLRCALEAFAPTAKTEELHRLGELAGRHTTLALGEQANRHLPELHTHDRLGNRIDEVQFHPAWHELLAHATEFGLHAAPWVEHERHAHLLRAAKFYFWAQVEAGHGCPISMTYASIPALRLNQSLARTWEPALAARAYDPLLRPIAKKCSALCGMAMTEKQGGTDVRANTTHATPTGSDDLFRLVGHKWFCSAPMSDAFLVLAQAPGGLTCFFLPRVLPDGSNNSFMLQRLKDKMGNRSNASAEIELDGTLAWMIGEEGRGVRTIVEMVNHTRLDCMLGSSGLLRMALLQAVWHCEHRMAFGKTLNDWPLMQNVLADLTLESEASTLLALRVAHSVDRAPNDPREAGVKRFGTALGKYWICKRAPAAIGEALECLGGNGYVEESMLPRLYREAPVNSIWEGSGNVNALDILRIANREPECIDAFEHEITLARSDERLRAHAEHLIGTLRRGVAESDARRICENAALLWQACLLLAHCPEIVADTFIASRIQGDSGRAFGTLQSPHLSALARRATELLSET